MKRGSGERKRCILPAQKHELADRRSTIDVLVLPLDAALLQIADASESLAAKYCERNVRVIITILVRNEGIDLYYEPILVR